GGRHDGVRHGRLQDPHPGAHEGDGPTHRPAAPGHVRRACILRIHRALLPVRRRVRLARWRYLPGSARYPASAGARLRRRERRPELGRVVARNALVDRWERGKRLRPGALVPVGGARVVVGELVVVAGLDRDADLALEPDRVLDVEAVERVLAAPRPRFGPAVHGQAVVRGAVLLLRAEGGAEVVLGPGAVEARRPGLAVDEDHVVALAVPVVHLALEDVDVQVAADVVPVAARVQDDVVALAGQVRTPPRAVGRERETRAGGTIRAVAVVLPPVAALARRPGGRVLPVPRRVEARVGGIDRGVLLVVDVEEEDALRRALVLDLEARAGRERHREPAVEPAPALRAHLERERDEVPPDAEADPEEVAERHGDARGRLAVPEHAEHRAPEVVRLVGKRHHRHPDVLDAAGPGDLAEHDRRARRHDDEVEVAAAAVPRREPPALEAPEASEVRERPVSDRHTAAYAICRPRLKRLPGSP